MEEWGNKRANEYFEANMPASVIRPKEGDPVRVVERFIRDKYEHRRYVASSIPPKSAAATTETVAETAPRRAAAPATAAAPTATARVPRQQQVAAPAPVVAPVKQEVVPDLLNLMDDPIPAPAVPAAAPAAAAGFGSTDFGDFTSSVPAQSAAPAASSQFSAFDSPMRPAAPVVRFFLVYCTIFIVHELV